jgi:hypothetical protein
MKIIALHDNIIFTFMDDNDGKGFDNISEGGIYFRSFDHDAKTARWGTVLVVGPDVTEVKAGDKIFIENLQWTEGHDVDGLKIWMTNVKSVMLVDSENE